MSTTRAAPPAPGADPRSDQQRAEHRLYLREEELDQAADLIFRAARRFWRAAEGPLADRDLGPAHYRALAAIRRDEGLSVSSLRERLGIAKQSLARVLKELDDAKLIARAPGEADKRERRLRLTDDGRHAERAASAALRERLAQIFRAAGADSVLGARAILTALAEEDG